MGVPLSCWRLFSALRPRSGQWIFFEIAHSVLAGLADTFPMRWSSPFVSCYEAANTAEGNCYSVQFAPAPFLRPNLV